MPDDMKQVMSFAHDQMPTVAKNGYDSVSNMAGSLLDLIQKAPETAPAALTKAGMSLGGLTQRGADAVNQAAKEGMINDARYQLAEIKQQESEHPIEKNNETDQVHATPRPTLEQSTTATPQQMKKLKRSFIAARFLNKAKGSNRASI